MDMKKHFALICLTLAVAGCASPSGKTAPGALVPSGDRITDGRISADREVLAQTQQRLRALNEAGVMQGSYALAKAQCWLDTSRTQYIENDRTGYVDEALEQSLKIISAMEADRSAKAGLDTPLIAGSTRLRDDLWVRLSQFKEQAATLSCNGATVACAEVRLVRAGHAEEQTGWRQAAPHVRMVEDAVQQAAAQAAACGASAAGASAITAATTSRETFVLMADALFRFDRSAAADLLPGGLSRLSEVAARLKGYKSIQSVTVVGHTDRLGEAAYNERLSKARAETVLAQLAHLGVQAAVTAARGVGEREPVTSSCGGQLSREKLIECLQPDRRVTIEVQGVVR